MAPRKSSTPPFFFDFPSLLFLDVNMLERIAHMKALKEKLFAFLDSTLRERSTFRSNFLNQGCGLLLLLSFFLLKNFVRLIPLFWRFFGLLQRFLRSTLSGGHLNYRV